MVIRLEPEYSLMLGCISKAEEALNHSTPQEAETWLSLASLVSLAYGFELPKTYTDLGIRVIQSHRAESKKTLENALQRRDYYSAWGLLELVERLSIKLNEPDTSEVLDWIRQRREEIYAKTVEYNIRLAQEALQEGNIKACLFNLSQVNMFCSWWFGFGLPEEYFELVWDMVKGNLKEAIAEAQQTLLGETEYEKALSTFESLVGLEQICMKTGIEVPQELYEVRNAALDTGLILLRQEIAQAIQNRDIATAVEARERLLSVMRGYHLPPNEEVEALITRVGELVINTYLELARMNARSGHSRMAEESLRTLEETAIHYGKSLEKIEIGRHNNNRKKDSDL
ncbi:hypothetical protein KY318_03600 [Candidatus Woesearchaeota archaeon]|nr:hypothetical protein [Candidatus Woesearchaeota archaeon]